MIARNPTRAVHIGSTVLGDGHPIVVQSMCATKTTNVAATVAQVEQLAAAGAGVVRIAVDTPNDCRALAEIRRRTTANLSVDLQENYRLAAQVAPWVDKIRYNPGHLHHHEPERPWSEKVRFLVDVAGQHDCAIRVGVNCGSVDPSQQEKQKYADPTAAMLASALEHCELLDRLGFTRYCVSLKDSDPARVVDVNRRFAAQRPDVPLHLGVTEAGMPPEGIWKTRLALEPLLAAGIGDTLRVSLTVPFDRKREEVEAGQQILDDVAAGRRTTHDAPAERRLNIISCPSCSRVENEAFVELAQQVREATRYAADQPITIAVMGCRVNGPGETDHADLGLWCGVHTVHLKRGSLSLGDFSYQAVLERLTAELDRLIAERSGGR
ncbi:MAG: flavodoxin-dependent (E)-4-hydroxy-3-methylbut-2-enyl-diphosphate synthase [Planctomycetaceae bacterium]|nr:flavodoxin-dependent (E)-4-hydroxy-3-methylbut-2-enyl-diphosphate synthase [Planctomycetaceae bacterium]